MIAAALAAMLDLAPEVRERGLLVFAARTEAGDWDLFAMRPDGSERRPLTRTPDFHEALPRVSPDGTRILCRRLPRSEAFHAQRHGAQGELLLLEAGSSTRIGRAGEFPWATWMPDGRSIACLEHRGPAVVDLEGKRTLRRLERQGAFQQLVVSPDGRWFAATTDAFDTPFGVARVELSTGALHLVSRVDCSTAEWFPGSRRLIFSKRPRRWVQLWTAEIDGGEAAPLYEEEGRHCYGAAVSPDGRYAVFTRDPSEAGDPGNVGGTLAILRLSDKATLLDLPEGWAPQWVEALK